MRKDKEERKVRDAGVAQVQDIAGRLSLDGKNYFIRPVKNELHASVEFLRNEDDARGDYAGMIAYDPFQKSWGAGWNFVGTQGYSSFQAAVKILTEK